MGQKVNPVGMRVGINKDWNTHWFANNKDYSTYLLEDVEIREFIENYFAKKGDDAAISHIEISRKKVNGKGLVVFVTVHTAKPGIVIGQGGETAKEIKKKLVKLVSASEVNYTAVEIKNPNLDATLVAQRIAKELENRGSFRMAQKKAIRDVKMAGAQGIKTSISGRLGGAEIARAEGYKEGTIALQTLRSDIDYAAVDAATQYGRLGVKVWICRGEVAQNKDKKAPANEGE